MQSSEIAEYLGNTPAPVAVKTLLTDLGLRRRISVAEVSSSLEQAVRERKAFAWPKYRNSPRYWNRDPSAVLHETILEIAAARVTTKTELVKSAATLAHNHPARAARAAVTALIKEGTLKAAKPVDQLLVYRADAPGALIDAAMVQLARRLKKLGVDCTNLGKLAINARALPERVLDSVRRLQPAPGLPVTVQSLRSALPDCSKPDVDNAVLSLADNHKLFLITHDHGWALPEENRQQLVWDGSQKLYVAVTLRD